MTPSSPTGPQQGLVEHAEPLMSLQGVTRSYGVEVVVHALREVSLDIRAGDLMSIVGSLGLRQDDDAGSAGHPRQTDGRGHPRRRSRHDGVGR